jgi:hypothetical protein
MTSTNQGLGFRVYRLWALRNFEHFDDEDPPHREKVPELKGRVWVLPADQGLGFRVYL